MVMVFGVCFIIHKIGVAFAVAAELYVFRLLWNSACYKAVESSCLYFPFEYMLTN